MVAMNVTMNELGRQKKHNKYEDISEKKAEEVYCCCVTICCGGD